MNAFSESLKSWQNRGTWIKLTGIDVFLVDQGEKSASETILILHGFPTSSYDWRLILPGLSQKHRVILLDFPGFGLSEKPKNYSYSLIEQTDIAILALKTLGIKTPIHILSHDMGTSVACELMARRERKLLDFDIRSLILMNGSVHVELAHLTPAQRLLQSPIGNLFAHISSPYIFKLQMRKIIAKPIPETELDDMWAQLTFRDGKIRLAQTICYIEERHRFWHRWIGALTRLDIPTLILWGPLDPVAVFKIAQRLASEIPAARLNRLEGLGHYPQLEDPDMTAQAILQFYDDMGKT